MKNIQVLWFLILMSVAGPQLAADTLRVGTVCNGPCNYNNAQLDQAIFESKLGDTIELTAGELFTCNCFLYAKRQSRGNGEEWITITSSRGDELPPYGTRVGPEHAPLMPKIRTTNTEPVFSWAHGVGWVTGINTAIGQFTIDQSQLYGPSAINNGDRVTLRDQDNNNQIVPFLNNKPYYVVNKTGGTFQLSATLNGAPITNVNYTPPVGWGRVLFTKVDPAHHYRLHGLEITSDGGGPLIYNLVRFGNMQEASYESLPYAMEISHCYIHGQRLDPTEGPRAGVSFAGAVDIHDNYISDIKDTGGDAIAISSFIAPGPVRVVNNYLEASSINTILGGGSAQIIGMVNGERGGVFQHNFYTKQGAWKFRAAADGVNNVPPTGICIEDEYVKYTNINQGWRCTASGSWERRDDLLSERVQKYVCKNVFELKAATNLFVEGNLFEKAWVDGQLGESILMQTIDRWQWYSPWTEFSDIVFRNNMGRKTSSILALFQNSHVTPNKNRNVTFENNLWYDIGSYNIYGGPGVGDMMRIEWGQKDLTFRNNTMAVRHGYRGLVFNVDAGDSNGSPGSRYFLKDSIFGNGPASLNMNCGDLNNRATDSSLSKIVIWNPNNNGFSNLSGGCATDITVMSGATANSLFRNEAANDYQVQSTSPAYRTGSTGRDLGADFLELNAATSNVEQGTPVWAQQAQLEVQPGSTRAVIRYTRPNDSACTFILFNNFARSTTHGDSGLPAYWAEARTGNIVEGAQVQFVLGTNVPLTASTPYWGVLSCGTWSLPVDFRTGQGDGSDSGTDLEFSTARSVRYANNAAMTGAVTLPSSLRHTVPVAARGVVYTQEGTTGPVRVFVSR